MSNKPWKRLEEMVAKDLGGRVQPGSGRYVGAEEDVKSRFFLVQCKASENAGVTIPKEELLDLAVHAERELLVPALVAAEHFIFGKSDYLAIMPAKDVPTKVSREIHSAVVTELDIDKGVTWNFPFSKTWGYFPCLITIKNGAEWGQSAVIVDRKTLIRINEMYEED